MRVYEIRITMKPPSKAFTKISFYQNATTFPLPSNPRSNDGDDESDSSLELGTDFELRFVNVDVESSCVERFRLRKGHQVRVDVSCWHHEISIGAMGRKGGD